ncbi:MAG TPA: SDR family NAD(P)-dependent oxidoreductase [Stellaceae bacterium]|nr:SDR family NAD(P)-dependent oxidoreductase [Stellaceae bacterium]
MGRTLEGKVAVVTGASRGIGAEIAAELAREGARVMLAARSADALSERAAAIGGQAAAHVADLREPSAPAALAAAAMTRFGRIDIVVANAGATKRGDFLALSDEDWQDGFALKFFAHMRLIRAAWTQLKEARGSVVIISGIGGKTPGAEFTIGGSVNAALLAFTKALADRAVPDGIRVNTINPGDVRTDRLARRVKAAAERFGVDAAEAERRMIAEDRVLRFGEPSDIAGLVSFIVGPRGGFLQGSIIDMDGGKNKTT